MHSCQVSALYCVSGKVSDQEEKAEGGGRDGTTGAAATSPEGWPHAVLGAGPSRGLEEGLPGESSVQEILRERESYAVSKGTVLTHKLLELA